MIRYGGPMLETQVAPISPEGATSGADFFMGYLLRTARPQRKIDVPFTTPKMFGKHRKLNQRKELLFIRFIDPMGYSTIGYDFI